MKIGQTLRRLVALKQQVSALEEKQPGQYPRCLILRPDDPVPADLSVYDSVHSIRRESQPERDLGVCSDVLEIVVKQPRRPLTITRGTVGGTPRIESVEPPEGKTPDDFDLIVRLPDDQHPRSL